MKISFTEGDRVSVQREVGAPWEDATYMHPVPSAPGWHVVGLSPTSIRSVPRRRLRFVDVGPLKLTDEQRSMIASAFVSAYDHSIDIAENKRRSLCCGGAAAVAASAQIVGARHAEKLVSFFYESLGCGGWLDPETQERNEQYYLDKISAMDEL